MQVFSLSTEASAKYACTVAEVFECMAIAGCKRVSARQANLPPMVTLDVKEKKLFSGLFRATHCSRQGDIHEDERILILHGRKGLQTWTAVVDKNTGEMSGSITNLDRTFAQFGHCTPQQP